MRTARSCARRHTPRNLPEHDRTVINAYRAFIEGEYAEARGLYQRLIDRDGQDADAWYGLGEAWFHDTAGPNQAPAFTQAIRAFRRTLDLDPDYALAYDHVQHMLGMAADRKPVYALVAPDSFALAFREDGRALVDSATLQSAIRRARAAGLSTARSWIASQPTTLRAHGAMVDAYLATGNYDAALGEVARFRNSTPVHPELPFVEARIRFASGDVDRAASQLRTALDTVAPQDFRPYQGTPTVVMDIAAAANVFAYQGDLANAAKALDLADQVRREVVKHPGRQVGGSLGRELAPGGAGRAVRGRGRAGGLPPAGLAERRRGRAHGDAGLAQAPDAQRCLRRHRALHRPQRRQHGPGRVPRHDGRAALARGAGAARAQPGRLHRRSADAGRARLRRRRACRSGHRASTPVRWRRRPGSSWATTSAPSTCCATSSPRHSRPAASIPAGACWVGCGCCAAAAYEQLGRRSEALAEYREVLAQWKSADESLKPFIRQAEQGLARLGEALTVAASRSPCYICIAGRA